MTDWIALTGGIAAMFTAAGAQDPDGFRQHDAHVHGEAVLSLVLEGETLTAELRAPLANIVGFEHAPQTDGQRAALDAAYDTLRGGGLYGVTGGACEFQSADLDAPFMMDGDGDSHDHDHDDHDHEHEHDDDHAHAELTATHVYTCSQPDGIRAINAAAFELFDGFTSIDTVYLGDRTQAAVLTPNQTELRLER